MWTAMMAKNSAPLPASTQHNMFVKILGDLLCNSNIPLGEGDFEKSTNNYRPYCRSKLIHY